MDFLRLMQGVIIEWKVYGQAGGPPNFEQPTVVQKKVKKNSDYSTILPIRVPSHIFGVLINQKHDIMIGEADIGVPLSQLNLSHKMYVLDIALHNILHVDKSDLDAGGNVIDVPLI